MSDWCCGSECDFWEADSRGEGFGWCKAPLPWEVLWNAGDMLHTNSGDECGFTLQQMVEAQAAWEPVIAARCKSEEVQE